MRSRLDVQLVRSDHPALLALIGATTPVAPSIVNAMTAFREQYMAGGNPLEGVQVLWWRKDDDGHVSIIVRDQDGGLSTIGFHDEPAYGHCGYGDIHRLADWFDRYGDGNAMVAGHLRALAADSPWRSEQ